MVSRWDWAVRLLTRRLWFKAALCGGAAIATAFVLAPLVPDKAADLIGADAVEGIVKIPSSSLLALATFLLGTISLASVAAASGAVTPQASKGRLHLQSVG